MTETIFTLAEWRVQPGREAEFVAAWQALGAVFLALPQAPQAGSGKLVHSLTEPGLYYSFGPWPDLAAAQAMRADPGAQAAIGRLRALCTEARPGSFKLVAEA